MTIVTIESVCVCVCVRGELLRSLFECTGEAGREREGGERGGERERACVYELQWLGHIIFKKDAMHSSSNENHVLSYSNFYSNYSILFNFYFCATLALNNKL